MRQPLVPRPRHAQLLGCGGRVLAGDRVLRLFCRVRAPPGAVGQPRVGARLDPHVDRVAAAELAEQADAVAGIHDVVELLGDGVDRCVQPEVLAHLVTALDVERQPRRDAERTQREHGTAEVRVPAAHAHELPVGLDELDGHDRCRQTGVAAAGAVRAGRARTADRDVRQRAEIVQRPASALQGDRELPVARPGTDRHGARRGVDLDRHVEARGADERAPRVGDAAERVAGTERVDPVGTGDELLQLLDRGRRRELVGVERQAVGPVTQRHPSDVPTPTRTGAGRLCRTVPARRLAPATRGVTIFVAATARYQVGPRAASMRGFSAAAIRCGCRTGPRCGSGARRGSRRRCGRTRGRHR